MHHLYTAFLGKDKCGVHKRIRSQYPKGRLKQLTTLLHILEAGYSKHAYSHLQHHKLKGLWRQKRADEDCNHMEVERCARVVKHSGDNRHPRKWYEVDAEGGITGEQARHDNHNRHQYTEKQYRADIGEKQRPEREQIHTNKADEKSEKQY